jgi:hypothetical protein
MSPSVTWMRLSGWMGKQKKERLINCRQHAVDSYCY